MAWTVTRYPSVFGNKKTAIIKMTADAATQTVETGLKVIEGYNLGYGSMSTLVGPKVFINSNASGVESMGVLGCSGFTSGDDLYVTVYGR
jgi:hypothetical protein